MVIEVLYPVASVSAICDPTGNDPAVTNSIQSFASHLVSTAGRGSPSDTPIGRINYGSAGSIPTQGAQAPCSWGHNYYETQKHLLVLFVNKIFGDPLAWLSELYKEREYIKTNISFLAGLVEVLN
jgi:hypothetical protein